MEFFLCFFLCFDFVCFVGDPRECMGYVAFPPTFGPREGRGEAANSYFVPFLGTPPSPPKGFETYMNSFFKTSMVRPGWGATGSSGRKLTRGCYALQHKYHLPSPPPAANFFLPTYVPQGGGRSIGPYADSLPLSSQFQGGSGGGGGLGPAEGERGTIYGLK